MITQTKNSASYSDVKRCDMKRVCQNMADIAVAFRLVVHVASNTNLFLVYLISRGPRWHSG